MNDSPPLPDRLTISRLMVLMAGLGFSLAFFAPDDFQAWPVQVDRYREMASTVLIGFSLPGLIYAWPSRPRRGRQGVGSLLWLALALGVLLLCPPAIGGPLLQQQAIGSSMALSCLHFVLPLMSLWMLLAGWLGGNLPRAAALACRRVARTLWHLSWPRLVAAGLVAAGRDLLGRLQMR